MTVLQRVLCARLWGRALRQTLVGLACVALPAVGLADEVLPQPETLIDRSVREMGGREAFESVKSSVTKGVVELVEMDIKGEIRIDFVAPDRVLLTSRLQGLGQQTQGIRGPVAWELSPVTEARLMTSEERNRLLESVSKASLYQPQKLYRTLKTVGIESVEDEPCFKVQMRRKGAEHADFVLFAKSSGLPRKTVTTRPSVRGPVKIVTELDGYRRFGALLSPTIMEQRIEPLNVVQRIRVESVEYNVDLPPGHFAVPDRVQELLRKREDDAVNAAKTKVDCPPSE